MRIGEVSQLSGITPNAVRYYHRIGLLPEPERTNGGYRLYDTSHLLALRRILRLRSLGLPIRQVKEVLEDPEKEEEALHSLREELSARILELEKRREQVGRVLEGDDVNIELSPNDLGRLNELAEEIPEDEWPETPITKEFTRELVVTIGAFRWPARYFGLLADLVRGSEKLVAAHPEVDEPTLRVAERFVALAGFPEDSPEVERLVEEAVELDRTYPLSNDELNAFWKNTFERNGIPPGDPFLKALYKLVLSTFSPAQRRFWNLLEKRMRELYGKGWLAEALEEWLGV